ncbi:MAG: phosphocholine cytidylyltransferase family protein [Candidatus Omnitrophica bacterium]|nr:phosphocholine cytidylyltransferase family protein [Candidatus Omnitrophota bacterium]
MKAIILAAGVGKRLFPLTQQTPKCMIPFNGKPLLGYHLDYLKNSGIDAVVLVVGHLREKIEDYAGTSWHGVPVRYYQSPDTQGGSLLSLWSARGEMDDDVLVMDADVLYPEMLLKRLITSKKPNCLLADSSSPNTGEEQVLYAENDRVFFISKKSYTKHKPIGESVGFLKISKSAAIELKQILEDFVAAGKKGIEHEDTYPVLMERVHVGFEPVHDLKWTEIDSMEDVIKAEAIANKV